MLSLNNAVCGGVVVFQHYVSLSLLLCISFQCGVFLLSAVCVQLHEPKDYWVHLCTEKAELLQLAISPHQITGHVVSMQRAVARGCYALCCTGCCVLCCVLCRLHCVVYVAD